MATAAFQLQILTASDYSAVRNALDVSLDENSLADTVIEQPQFGPSAESEILARDPLALGYESGVSADSVKWARVRRATILLTAARIAPALPNVTAEGLGDYKVSLAPVDLLKKSALLRGMAQRELAAYLNTDGQVTVLPAAWIARGGRAL